MTDQWRIKKINEVGRLVTGKTPSSSKPESFGDKYPFITPTDMHDCRYASSTARYLSEEGAAGQKTLRIPAGSVAVSCIGWQMGKSIVTTRPSFTNQQLHTILPNDEVDFLFLYYSLCTQRVELLSLGSAAGVRTPIINKSAFGLLSIAVPPLKIQRKIASILSAYDDLIENNTRRIAIQEEMAQAIYREWFVNFRFPGHENVKLVDSPLGKIPHSWCERTLEEVTSKIGSGATPTGGKNAYKDSGITLIRSLNVYDFNFHDDGLAFIDEQQAGQLDNVTVERHDILLNITGASVARCCMVRADLLPARVNQHVAIIRADRTKADPFFLLSTINSERHKKQILALAQGGATREALTKTTIQKYGILLPDSATMRRFGTIAEGIFEQREILQRKNQNLRTTRDLLLPKLISGQLDVEDLDIDVSMTTAELAEVAGE